LNLLLDTHALLWLLLEDSRLGERQVALIQDERNTIFVSAVSSFETAYKYRIGKLPEGEFVVRNLAGICSEYDLQELKITFRHGALAGSLEGHHRDPFDRLLAAQSLTEGLPVVTKDAALGGFGAHTIW
jgi:PIN domain nuclease of toxin-antitoxin system